MQIGQAFDRVSKRLFVDLRVFRPDSIPDRTISDYRESDAAFLNCRIDSLVRFCPHVWFHLVLQSAKLLPYESRNDM